MRYYCTSWWSKEWKFHKRAVIPDPDPDTEQASKRPRLEGGGEGDGQSSPTAAAVKTAEELKYEEEVNGDSASSDEEEN